MGTYSQAKGNSACGRLQVQRCSSGDVVLNQEVIGFVRQVHCAKQGVIRSRLSIVHR